VQRTPVTFLHVSTTLRRMQTALEFFLAVRAQNNGRQDHLT